MQVELKVRRLRCANPGCAARTFSEACADFPRHAQRSARLQERQVALGFSVGAEAGSVLLDRFHMSASPDTLLRTMKRQPLPQHPTPRVLGVDDWAIRKGVRYGTILVDLERHQVVDVIKERSADALRDWLSVYPGIEIITRDRASDYSRAGTRAAPRALQLADRWHLLCNLSGVVQEWLLRERQHWMTVVAQVKAQLHLPNPEASPSSPPATMPISQKKRREQYREVLLLDQQGLPSRQVARQTGVKYATVRWWLKGGEGGPDRRGPLTVEHRDYVEKRWHQGGHSAAGVHRELLSLGYTGSIDPIRWMWYHLDLEQGLQERSVPARPRARRKDVNLTALTRLLTTPRDDLTDADRRPAVCAGLCEHSPLVSQGYALIQQFRQLFVQVKEENGPHLRAWLETAGAATILEIRQLAASVQRDLGAISAAVTLSWSNAQTEGQVTKLKLVKRRHYGRASFELLRRSVLLA
ncbi:transposase (plasmid) [Deinococcus aetherius]|uniref:Transposase n=1 Tax=Deinococcus aetherius TaxID=200252 RepID=A0ABN6RQ45_9DEIO|nr:transposase [Deinococcus aetherius]